MQACAVRNLDIKISKYLGALYLCQLENGRWEARKGSEEVAIKIARYQNFIIARPSVFVGTSADFFEPGPPKIARFLAINRPTRLLGVCRDWATDTGNYVDM